MSNRVNFVALSSTDSICRSTPRPMFNQNRIYRVFQLMNYLRSRPAKSIDDIAEHLETSERTVYRYIELLESLGFILARKSGNRYALSSPTAAHQLPFTTEEADYLERILRSTGRSNPLTEGILQKIRLSDVEMLAAGANIIYSAHLGRFVELINLAITEKRQLMIRSYASANSQTIADRHVEPVGFTDNYRTLSAFEIATGKNKYFDLERMGGVEVLEEAMTHEARHHFHQPDVFGYQGRNPTKKVHWVMNLRANLLLREQFPACAAHIETLAEGETYQFQASVQRFDSPARFVLGMGANVHVLGSPAFLRHLTRPR